MPQRPRLRRKKVQLINDPTAFKQGDVVKVVSKPYGDVRGWTLDWVADMDGMLGKVGKILDEPSSSGCRLETPDGTWFWFPSCSLVLVAPSAQPVAAVEVPPIPLIAGIHDPSAFKRGERVRVIGKPRDENTEDWSNSWPSDMDKSVGRVGVIRSSGGTSGFDIELDNSKGMDFDSYSYPSYCLARENETAEAKDMSTPKRRVIPIMPAQEAVQESVEELKTNAPEQDENVLGAFKVNDYVLVTRAPKGEVKNYVSGWGGLMNECVGKRGIVTGVGGSTGYQVMFGLAKIWWMPSCCLEKVTRSGQAKKKRVRVGKGPWDAAPCTHLRWNLMGFFREKLAFVKTEGGPAEIKVRCTKCKCEMTLRAQ